MEAYLSFSQENLWYEIWPELSLAIGAIVVLGINLFYKSDSKNGLSGSLAILFQAILLVFHLFDYLAWHHTFDRTTFSGMLHQGIRRCHAELFPFGIPVGIHHRSSVYTQALSSN